MSLNGKCLGGLVLVASPIVRSKDVARSVVFVGEHDEYGANGVILNRPQHKLLRHVNEKFLSGILADMPIYSGGPTNKNNLTVTSWLADRSAMLAEISYMLGEEEVKEKLSQHKVPQFRGFLGYLKWDQNELEKKIENGLWMVVDTRDLFYSNKHGDALWYELVEKYYPETLFLCNIPYDIASN